MKGRLCILAICCCSWLSIFSQTPALDSLRQELSETPRDTSRLTLLLKIIGDHDIRLRSEEIISFATEALALARQYNIVEKEIVALYALAQGEFYGAKEEEALQHMQQCLSLIEENGIEDDRLVMSYNLLGSIHSEQGQFDTALDYFFKSLALAEEHGYKDNLGPALSNIAEVYSLHDEPQKAKDYWLKALKSYEEDQDSSNIAAIYNNLGSYATDPDTAIYFLSQALRLFEKLKFERGIAFASGNIGAQLGEKGLYREGIPYFKKSIPIFEKEDFKPGLISHYMNMGTIYGQLNDFALSDTFFQKSIRTAKAIDHKLYLKDTYLAMAELFEEKNQAAKALTHFKLAAALKDTLFNQSKAAELAEAETRHETEKKSRQLVEQELIIAQQRNNQKNLLIGSILAILLIGGLFQYIRQRQRMRQREAELALQLERTAADQLREMDRLKSNFFANISHEFRTPLTLLLSPLRQMREGSFRGDVQRYYDIMIRNGERLMNLINQLLDLSKLESGKMHLQAAEGDLAAFVRAIAYAFESLAVRKQIHFTVETPPQAVNVYYDKDKLEKILTNLLSNAFKFTADEGTIKVRLTCEETAIIQISDNGIGIPADHLPHIFERFYQTIGQSDLQAGSGIGLALTKELVALHHGDISVESKENEYTCFTISLPLGKVHFSAEQLTPIELTPAEGSQTLAQLTPHTAETIASPHKIETTIGASQIDTDLPLVLVAEDNEDVRQYIIDQLSADFRVVAAQNGKIGLEKALEIIPDLILSDIMMPEMDGVALCQALKTNEKTSHIPVIMLTARAEREDRIEGLTTGADDYLIKPFDATELKVRIHNLIEQRRKLQERFGKNFSFKPGEINISSVDEQFLEKVKSAINEHLDDEFFGVVELANQVGLSRSQLHRKLKGLTGNSPNAIIREMRLLSAHELLEKGAGNASEVAFMVGFNSLSYFSACFSERFGYSPTAIMG